MTTDTSTLTSNMSVCESLSPLEEFTTLRNKVESALQLATDLLGQEEDKDDTTTELVVATNTSDLVETMQKFACLKEELTQLQRESQLTQRALVATQCSQTCIAMRLGKISTHNDDYEDDDDKDGTMAPVDWDVLDAEEECLDHGEDGDDYDDEESMEDVPSPEDDNLEQEIMNILPTKSRSLGVGLLSDMEQCIVEWQQAFQTLNDQHEYQVQACQADLERLHVRLDAMQALYPSGGMEAAEAAQKARDQLEQLVMIVEEFPSKARVQALQRELAASKQVEEQTLMELATAVEQLETLQQREQDLLRRLEVATRPPIPLTRPKNGPVPTVRLLRHTKKKLQKLFHLDRYNHHNSCAIHKPQPIAPLNDDNEANSSTSASISEGALLDTVVDSVVQSIDLSHLITPTTGKDHSLGQDPNVLSHDVDLEELSVTDSLENFHRHDVLSVYGSPTKSHSTDDDDLDICKMDTDDTTSTRSEAASYFTETETDSTSGTPPPKFKTQQHQPGTSKNLLHMAKSLWWVQ